MKIELPSMLAFERKFEVSDALMHSGNWSAIDKENAEWEPIKITKRQNRSTQSAHGTDADKMPKPNPKSSDSDDANLPHNNDTLKVSFTLRIVGNVGEPFGCNDSDFTTAIKDKVSEYRDEGLQELSHRYAQNIASGRFLWRNRVCANNLIVTITINGEEVPISFNGYDIPLNDFETTRRNNPELEKLTKVIYDGLNSEDSYTSLQVDAYVQLGHGQHVFPSQEMNMGEAKKVLFKLDDCAALHSVKIGNAIRTIDDWYNGAEFPIAVEPFGAVTQQGKAYRKNEKEGDFYTLMMHWVNNKKELDHNQKCFVIANLIRGGVFSRKK